MRDPIKVALSGLNENHDPKRVVTTHIRVIPAAPRCHPWLSKCTTGDLYKVAIRGFDGWSGVGDLEEVVKMQGIASGWIFAT